MKILLYLLFIPFAAADTAPNCQDLSKFVSELEISFMQQELKNCRGVTTEGLVNAGKVEEEVIQDFKCRSMAAIEASLKQLEIEQAVLTGLSKLKADLLTHKNDTAGTDRREAQAAGKKFVDTLITAQSLETLLDAKGKDGKALLPELKKTALLNRNSVEKMKAAVSGLCGDTKAFDACRPGVFVPSYKAVEEINGLLNFDLNEDQVEKWKTELMIKKASDQSDYSFQVMRNSLTTAGLNTLEQGKLNLSREQLQAIIDLAPFANPHAGSLNDKINKSRAGITAHIKMQQFKFMLEDAKVRQQLEVQSKASLLYLSHFLSSTHLSAEEKNHCAAAKSSYAGALSCATAMEKNSRHFQGAEQARLLETLAAINVSKNYLQTLDTSDKECSTPDALALAHSSGGLPADCEATFSQNHEEVSSKLRALQHLRQKLALENKKTADLRNFAHEKMLAMKCFNSTQESNISCEKDLAIAPEALSLTANSLDISLVLARPGATPTVTDISSHCQDPKTRLERSLCAFGNGEGPSDIIQTNNRPELYEASTEAPAGGTNVVREAMLAGLTRITSDIVQAMTPKPQMPNPYPYNDPRFRHSGPAVPLADKIAQGAYMQEVHFQQSYQQHLGGPSFFPGR